MIKIVNENKDVFNLKNTNVSYYNDILDDGPLNGTGRYSTSDYYRFEKGVEGTIEYMTAKEYLDGCSDIFNGNPYGGLNKENISKYAELMKNGTKFPLPYLNMSSSNIGQEGRHRMLAAAEAFGENEKFPVLIVRDTKATDEEILDYAKKKYPKDPSWVVRMVNAVLHRNDEEDEPEEESEGYEVVQAIDISRFDTIDAGDGWIYVTDYTLMTSGGMEIYGIDLRDQEDVYYMLNDTDEVKLKIE